MGLIKDIAKKLFGTKTVYRFVTDEEVAFFESANIGMLGDKFKGESLSNSHKYKDEAYLHFFDTKDLPSHVINSLPGNKTHLCSFEIDNATLFKYQGEGYYPPQGYDFDYSCVKEYAIPVNEYNTEWFTGSTPLKNNNMQDKTIFDTQTPLEPQ